MVLAIVSAPVCMMATLLHVLFHRLMKIAAEFTIEASQAWTAEMATKRTTYIHCVAQQLCQVTYLADTDMEALQTVMVNLLSEIESVESAGGQLETFD